MSTTIENQQTALARNEELVVQELPDEVLIYDLKTSKAHCLNSTASFVWKHCNGQTTAAEIASLMSKEFRAPVSEDVVWFTLNKLSKADLLQQRITVPAARADMSRRSAMRRLGVGALFALPAVMSIVTPTPAAAASVPAVCLSCIKKIVGVSDCGICTDVQGACFDNSGCGNGQFFACQTCGVCLGVHGAVNTVSWVAQAHGC